MVFSPRLQHFQNLWRCGHGNLLVNSDAVRWPLLWVFHMVVSLSTEKYIVCALWYLTVGLWEISVLVADIFHFDIFCQHCCQKAFQTPTRFYTSISNSCVYDTSWSLTIWSLNSSLPSAAYMRQRIGPALVQIIACRLVNATANHDLNQCWVIVDWTP